MTKMFMPEACIKLEPRKNLSCDKKYCVCLSVGVFCLFLIHSIFNTTAEFDTVDD
jgi:hypothetical protein